MGIFSVTLHTIFSVGHPQRFLPSSWLVLNCQYKEERGWLLMFLRERWESYSESQSHWQQKIFIFLENFLARKYFCDATNWRNHCQWLLKNTFDNYISDFLTWKQNNFVWKCQFSFFISLKTFFELNCGFKRKFNLGKPYLRFSVFVVRFISLRIFSACRSRGMSTMLPLCTNAPWNNYRSKLSYIFI